MDGSNWQKIDLFEYQINIRSSVMRPISRRCAGFLRSLSLRCCKNVEDYSLRSLTKYCPNLEELDLNGCIAITDRLVVCLFVCLFVCLHPFLALVFTCQRDVAS